MSCNKKTVAVHEPRDGDVFLSTRVDGEFLLFRDLDECGDPTLDTWSVYGKYGRIDYDYYDDEVRENFKDGTWTYVRNVLDELCGY